MSSSICLLSTLKGSAELALIGSARSGLKYVGGYLPPVQADVIEGPQIDHAEAPLYRQARLFLPVGWRFRIRAQGSANDRPGQASGGTKSIAFRARSRLRIQLPNASASIFKKSKPAVFERQPLGRNIDEIVERAAHLLARQDRPGSDSSRPPAAAPRATRSGRRRLNRADERRDVIAQPISQKRGVRAAVELRIVVRPIEWRQVASQRGACGGLGGGVVICHAGLGGVPWTPRNTTTETRPSAGCGVSPAAVCSAARSSKTACWKARIGPAHGAMRGDQRAEAGSGGDRRAVRENAPE